MWLPALALALVGATEVRVGADRDRRGGRGLQLNTSDLSVSGLSAGAFMAVQFHVSYSKTVRGVGVIAGGPYWCAQDNLGTATHACMTKPDAIDPEELVFFTRQAERVHSIDPLANLEDAKVYIFAGELDSVVAPGVGRKLVTYYETLTKNTDIKTVFNVSAEHTMPTVSYGNPCGFKGSPYIGNCGYDAAFAVLSHAWPGVARAKASDAVQAHLRQFDQRGFFAGLPNSAGMATKGYVYIPARCASGGGCRLHVAFHGCLQGADTIGDVFVTHAGYNAHAEVNGIVVLYPQAFANTLNPKGCFDWWGFTSPSYACKLGVQVAGVHSMIDALVAGRIPASTT